MKTSVWVISGAAVLLSACAADNAPQDNPARKAEVRAQCEKHFSGSPGKIKACINNRLGK